LANNQAFIEEETRPAAAPFLLVVCKNPVGAPKGSGQSAVSIRKKKRVTFSIHSSSPAKKAKVLKPILKKKTTTTKNYNYNF